VSSLLPPLVVVAAAAEGKEASGLRLQRWRWLKGRCSGLGRAG
jgi:hypothetical protein